MTPTLFCNNAHVPEEGPHCGGGWCTLLILRPSVLGASWIGGERTADVTIILTLITGQNKGGNFSIKAALWL